MKVLVIRRDNIGDLVCTTPVFSSLRRAYPDAFVAALVNTYSAPVIANNPDIDQVFAYTKGKHSGNFLQKIAGGIKRLRLFWTLRAHRFDVAIAIGESSVSLAKAIGPKRIITAGKTAHQDTLSIRDIEPLHAVEAAHAFLGPLGINSRPGPLYIHLDPTRPDDSRAAHITGKPVIALHLSARKPSQRWPLDRFVELAKRLHAASGASFLVFWSPGSENNALHPGDDEKAKSFEQNARGLPVVLYPTSQLEELIAGMALCDLLICGDGGAMHIGAGLGKPVVALFGDSPPQRWKPWQVPSRVLQPSSRDVSDLAVDEVFAATLALLDETKLLRDEADDR